MRHPVRVNGRVVGVVEGERLLLRRDPARHFYRRQPGWAISSEVLKQAEAFGARVVEVHTPGVTYTAPLAAFKTHGVPLHHGDRQVLLPVHHWAARMRPVQLGLEIAGSSDAETARAAGSAPRP